MSTPFTQKPEQIPERIGAALEMVYAGINRNELEMVDTALLALADLNKQAIETGQYFLLEKVNQGLKKVFVSDPLSQYSLLPKVISGKVSEDILEQILEHTTPTPTHYIWNAGISKMSSRMSLLIANNYAKFKTLDNSDVAQVLSQLHETEHAQAFSFLYKHVLTSTLSMDELTYHKVYCKGEENIFKMLGQKLEEEKNLPLMTQVLLNNQDTALAHIDRLRGQPGNTLEGLSFAAVAHLHNEGFERLAPACGIKLLNGHKDIDYIYLENVREFVDAQNMGIPFDKDYVVGKLTGRQSPFVMPQAIYYALTSKEFQMADLVAMKNTIESCKGKERVALEESLMKGVRLSLREIFKKATPKKTPDMIEKADFMINWTLGVTQGASLTGFTTAIMGLRHFPDSMINKHPALRDSKFARDVGL
ncbi:MULTISPECIES: hypothetical protein [Pseudomonas]|uniref:hypothetical protein n=1 Tax=Pseudomonas TaxID=286 RepID=UPI000F035C44|nr:MULTISPECIES: hypothetical protein [Pseudomonas]MBD8615529.1 hypothetical protein [Pseudomonas putida]MBD8681819.1 hypothetical protein [Pseudomonas sp. CFBP 13719]